MNAIVPKSDFTYEFLQGSIKKAAAAVEAKSGDLWMVPPSALRIIPGFNVRVTGTAAWDVKISALADSMLAEGFYRDKPFTAYVQKDGDDNLFYITDGHRRFEALQKALAVKPDDFPLVPVLVKPPGSSLEDLTVALAKTGEPLTPFELSIVVKRLTQGGAMTEAEAARRLAISPNYVADLLLLQSASNAVKKFVLDGHVSASLVIKEMKKDPKGLAERLKTAQQNVMTRGGNKVTAKNLPTAAKETKPEEPSAEKPKHKTNPNRRVIEFKGLAGSEYPLSQISEFSKIGDGDWYRLHDEKPAVAVLLEDVNFRAVLKKKDVPPGVDVTAGTLPPDVQNEAADL